MVAKSLGKRIPVLAGLLLAASLTAQGQMQPGGGMQQSPGQTPAGQPGMNPGGANPGGANPGVDSPQMRMQNMQDSDFIKHIYQNNDAQIRLSQIAQQKSTSDDVKEFSERMVQIHNQLNQQFQPLGKQLEVKEPKKPDKKVKKQLDQLQSLSGAALDSAYLQDMAAEQQQGMKLFSKEASSGQKTSAALTAKQDETALEQHFQILQKIAHDHNVTLESSGK